MEKLGKVVDSLAPAVSFLADPKVEEREQSSDRVSGIVSSNAATTSQATTTKKKVFSDPKDSQDDFRSQAFVSATASLNPAKLVKLGTGSMSTSTAIGTNVCTVELPKGFYNQAKMPAYGQTRYFAQVRTGFEFEIQVNAAMGIAGALLAYYTPAGVSDASWERHSLFMRPHVLINLQTMTSGRLKIPHTSYKAYVGTDTADLGTLRVMVWSPPTIPTGTNNDVEITVMGAMVNLDLQNPRPQGPVRQQVDVAENMNCLNLATGLHTRYSQSVALCGESARPDPKTAGARTSVKNLFELLKVDLPAYAETIDWTTAQTRDTAIVKQNWLISGANAMFKFSTDMYSYCRGSIVVTITVFGTPLLKGRLKICWYPNTHSDFDAANSDNSIFSVLDLGLQSTLQMTLPYSFNTRIRPVTDSYLLGRFQIFVLNRLSGTSATATTCRFTIFSRAGDDFQFLAPRTNGVSYQGRREKFYDAPEPSDPADDWQDALDEPQAPVATTDATEAAAAAAGLSSKEETAETPENNSGTPKMLNTVIKKVSVVPADHMNFTYLLARAAAIGTYSYTASATKMTIAVPSNGPMAVFRLFHYWAGDMNVHMHNSGDDHVTVAHTYDTAIPTSEDAIASAGAVVIPPKGSATIRVPFYSAWSVRPTRLVDSLKPFGELIMKSHSPGKLVMWISFNNVELYFPLGVPKKATLRSWMTSEGLSNVKTGDYDLVQEGFTFGDGLDTPLYKIQERIDARSVPCLAMNFLSDLPSTQENRDLRMEVIRKARANHLKVVRYRLPAPPLPNEEEEDFVKDLTTEGIESNPGPGLVYRDRGLYKHYGVEEGGKVIHLNSENMFAAAIDGKVGLQVSPYDDSWILEKNIPMGEAWKHAYETMESGTKYTFSGDFNCETFAKGVLKDDSVTQAAAMTLFGTLIVVVSGAAAMQQSPSDFVKKLRDGIASGANKMKQDLSGALDFVANNIFEGITSDIVKAIAKLLVRIVCYGILFCSSPNMLTAAAVTSLIAMDLSNIKGLSHHTKELCRAMMHGELHEMVLAFSNLMQDNSEERYFSDAAKELANLVVPQGIQDFNQVSMAGKNLEWWFKKFMDFIEWIRARFAPSEKDRAISYLENHVEQTAALLTEVDDLLIDSRNPQNRRSQTFQDLTEDAIRRMQALTRMARRACHHGVLATYTNLTNKLIGIPKPATSSSSPYRMEPIGVWFSGPPGCGKSSLTYALMSLVTQKLADTGLVPLDESNTIFTHPTGSEYYDGYNGQFFHVVDDLGQNREENDIADLCQVISSVPFTLPMADLEEKGVKYSSKVVIATTNRNDFVTQVLESPKALERRFPFRFWVRVRQGHTNTDGKLDFLAATTSGAVQRGHCWEVSRNGITGDYKLLDLAAVADEIVGTYKVRAEGLRAFDTVTRDFKNSKNVVAKYQMPNPGNAPEEEDTERIWSVKFERDCEFDEIELGGLQDDEVFECLKRPQLVFTSRLEKGPPKKKFIEWIQKKNETWKQWLKRIGPWCAGITALASVVTAGVTLYCMLDGMRVQYAVDNIKDCVNRLRNPEEPTDEQRAYTSPTAFKKVVLKKPVEMDNPQGAYSANPTTMKKIARKVVYQSPSTSEFTHLAMNCISLHTNVGDVKAFAVGGKQFLLYAHVLNAISHATIDYNGLTHDIDFEKTTIEIFETSGGPQDLSLVTVGNLPFSFKKMNKHIASPTSGDGILLGRTNIGIHTTRATNINPRSYYTVDTKEYGLLDYDTGMTYECQNMEGMCGSILIQKQNGAWKIVGMHHAGDGRWYGHATPMFPKAYEQGLIVDKKPNDKPIFTPTKSKLRPSPLHGIVETEYEPAPLHPKDKRIEVEVENLVKKASSKYESDVYEVDDDLMEMVATELKKKVFAVCGMTREVDIVTAINGIGGLNKIDLNTSPGTKYVQIGKTKKDLIMSTPVGLIPTPEFEEDVLEALEAIRQGKGTTTFTSFLKDEIVKKKKVADGNPRVVESCPMDYVVAYRMIMAEMYEKIYSSPAAATGVAVGINPALDYHALAQNFEGNIYGLDYTRWDGRLPAELMRKGVEILAACHVDCDLVKNLHEPVITSTHFVSDEIFTIEGGMPSGAPCTSVLNSICNILASVYITVLTSDNGYPFIVTYGDDVVLSTEKPIDSVLFTQAMRYSFGMIVTPASKVGTDLRLDKTTVTFLKRHFRFFPGTRRIVGVLELNSMLQKIQWCHGLNEFKQQLDSFLCELVMHGETIYQEVTAKMDNMRAKYRIYVPSYRETRARVFAQIFE